MERHDVKRDDMGTVYVGITAIFSGMLYVVWLAAHGDISYWGLKWTWHQLGCADWALSPGFVKQWRHEAATLALNPESLSLEQLVKVMNKAGYLFIWIPLAMTLRSAWLAHTHPANRTRRRITAQNLPRIMAKHSPAVIPSLYYGDLLNTDPYDHRSAINPEEWAATNSLIVNGMLDRIRCRALFVADLGAPVSSLSDLSRHEKAMFAIFGARLLADGADHGAAQVLLDQLNRSCHTGSWNDRRGYPDLALCDAAFAKYASHPDAEKWLAKHPYPRTLLHAMHAAALAFGRLPSSHFRWLKGIDRPLWYALNTTGRKAPFVESAAVFTQTMWEDFASDRGYRLTQPCVDDAVDGIEAYLVKVGLLSPSSCTGAPS
ncbi:conjugal transfer protein TrbA [Massilia atriviolacea]|uniref:Conjugal transfer protein TrbA n=1 Tax=Massilia atriviolacea TaxID=2495579 RepID=A0A430HCK1_9BURK|nr:conjugal transfer protein TrbA [Massilia atriviolacea]RSZ55255.1 conjugal transfer protein TrbA [Massilia atriviolacea]